MAFSQCSDNEICAWFLTMKYKRWKLWHTISPSHRHDHFAFLHHSSTLIYDLTWYFNSAQEPADPASSNELGHQLTTMLGASADDLSHATKRHKPGNSWWPLSLTSLRDGLIILFLPANGRLLDWLYIVCLVTSWDLRCILWFHHSHRHPLYLVVHCFT